MNLVIRKIKKEDAKELAHNIALVWNSTYKGIVDLDFLEGLYMHEDDNAKRIAKQAMENLNYYVLELNNRIVGWIYYEYNTDILENAAEIHSLYILKEYQNRGYGTMLLKYAISDIKSHNINKLVIGCLDGNPANDFYKHMGGKHIKNQLFREKYNENIYLFEL